MAFRRYVFGILGNEAKIIILYYSVPCCLSTDPKIHDLEILDGHFTLNFHYYTLHFHQLGCILTVESVYTRDQRRCAEADRDLQNI